MAIWLRYFSAVMQPQLGFIFMQSTSVLATAVLVIKASSTSLSVSRLVKVQIWKDPLRKIIEY